jgi:hypothetical protein
LSHSGALTPARGRKTWLALGSLTLTSLAFIPLACDQFEDPDIAQIRSIEPDSGAVGSLVVIDAENLLDNTRVIFPDEVLSPVAAISLDQVLTIVPEGARSGDVVLETGGERSSSRGQFTVIPPPPSTPSFFVSEGQAVGAFTGGCRAPSTDDGYAAFTLPFPFPFYGRVRNEMFVTTNGLITFGDPRPCDNNGNASDFPTTDKIAVLGFDLEPGIGGAVRVNAGPERVVVTWSEVPLCRLDDTSNTFQVVLFPDGRILMNFGYLSTRGIGTGCLANSATGSITGITPRAPVRLVQVTYSVETPLTVGAQEAVLGLWFPGRFFDLENRSLLFTPLVEAAVFGGYRIELPPPER